MLVTATHTVVYTDKWIKMSRFPIVFSFCLRLLPHQITWKWSYVSPASVYKAIEPKRWDHTPTAEQSGHFHFFFKLSIFNMSSNCTNIDTALPWVFSIKPVMCEVPVLSTNEWHTDSYSLHIIDICRTHPEYFPHLNSLVCRDKLTSQGQN